MTYYEKIITYIIPNNNDLDTYSKKDISDRITNYTIYTGEIF